jgi:hypothetical protein
MSEYPAAPAAALLPNEPRIDPAPAQQALTARFLLPALADLKACLLTLRAMLDPVLQARQPTKHGKPYPLGQCLEISSAVLQQLQQLRQMPQDGCSVLQGQAARGWTALAAFLRAGGSLRQVWGDLRGEYFQNAFAVGTLYVDVSNDTVVATKPKVEILPFGDANLSPVADYFHFARIASRYWGDQVYPNHVLPELAPYCPLVHVTASGTVQLNATTGYMVALTLRGAFRPSEQVLALDPMPDSPFTSLKTALAGLDACLAVDPVHGRGLALAHCDAYRRHDWHRLPAPSQRIMQAVRQVNQRLASTAA